MPRNPVNLTGQTFGRWTVLAPSLPSCKGSQSRWLCECVCGNRKSGVLYNALTTGRSTSCGCSRKKYSREEKFQLGRAKRMYQAMKRSCRGSCATEDWAVNPNSLSRLNDSLDVLGVCPSWLNSFSSFLEDMGLPPSSDHYLVSQNTSLPFGPDNCVWFKGKPQTKAISDLYEYNSELLPLYQIARKEDVAYCSLRNRIVLYGLSVADAVQYCKTQGLTFKSKRKQDE